MLRWVDVALLCCVALRCVVLRLLLRLGFSSWLRNFENLLLLLFWLLGMDLFTTSKLGR